MNMSVMNLHCPALPDAALRTPCRSWRSHRNFLPTFQAANGKPVVRSWETLPWKTTHCTHSTRSVLRCQALTSAEAVASEQDIDGMAHFLDSLKWDSSGLVAAICQHVDTGELLMQAFADRAAVSETLQTGLATFYSRSRKGRWCKGETSGHFIKVLSVHPDCDRDSLVYLSDPIGPACHTGAPSCWFSEVQLEAGAGVREAGAHTERAHAPATTLQALERTIQQRRAMPPGGKPSWTAKLLADPALLCAKVREEAGELAATLEAGEGAERAASEAADLLYHALVLLNLQGVAVEDVMGVLRTRFGTSGIAEKAARAPKQAPHE